MVAEALTLVGLNFPQSEKGARSQNPGAEAAKRRMGEAVRWGRTSRMGPCDSWDSGYVLNSS